MEKSLNFLTMKVKAKLLIFNVNINDYHLLLSEKVRLLTKNRIKIGAWSEARRFE